MGKIRIKQIGIEEIEKEQKRKIDARREGKKAKKNKVKGVGLKGGERVAVVEGISDEALKKLKSLEQESTRKPSDAKADSGKKPKAKKKKKIRSKRYKDAAKLVKREKLYPISQALELVKKTSTTKFNGSVEVHIVLDPKTLREKGRKRKQKEKASFRTTVSFPHGTGKKIRVAIATDELIEKIKDGNINFDVLVAAPSQMSKLAKVARILGPKGLMPNPKTGTISDNPESLAQKLSKGQTAVKTEPDNPLIHIAIGKVSFETKQLQDNFNALIGAIGKPKITKISLNSTMSPGIKVNLASL